LLADGVGGDAGYWAAGEEFEVGAAAVGGDDGQVWDHLVELVELGDDLIGAGGIVVAVAQDERFSDAILEAALVIDGIADIEQAMVRVEIDEDADAAGSVAAQRHDDHGTIAVEVSAFVESFVGLGIEFQGRRVDGRKFLSVGGDDVASGLHRGIVGELQFFAGEKHRKAGKIHQTTSMIEVDVGEDDPAKFIEIGTGETHEGGKRNFGSEQAGEIFELGANEERVGGDFFIEVHGIAGVDEQVAAGMLDEDAAGGGSEGIAGEGAGGFDPASGEVFQRSDGGSNANVRGSGGKRVSVEIDNVGGDASEKGEKYEQESGATQPHTKTRHDQGPPQSC